VITETPQKDIIPKNKIKMGFNHIPTYEGDEDPKIRWFVYEKLWDVADVKDEDKQMAQFSVALRHRALTWFMNYT
jgi:endo-beta-N-acetylglucosaminidase D